MALAAAWPRAINAGCSREEADDGSALDGFIGVEETRNGVELGEVGSGEGGFASAVRAGEVEEGWLGLGHLHPVKEGTWEARTCKSRRQPGSDVGETPITVSFALLDWRTGFQPVRADSASRLSAYEATGWKPVGQDRRDAYPPANLTVLGETPARLDAQAFRIP